ncbi:leukocyte immunoglobulin-like receptor subfamily B member 1 [Sceloporus undulatus]|uniref:leukocyte immunoglobulin-like receptor subfamily B member 1 n=1 Tax=Sceloporus undulatus TaxID=8520 RepID=UPI001C4BF9BB|nr:leukocyte immunoglobulin-like receptor subfamily B member 1 [Sceloporus undulatus]
MNKSSLEHSESLELLITDPSLPRPEISIHPSRSIALGTEVKIHCKTRDGPMKFYLHLTGRTTGRWTMKPDFDMAEFCIHNVSQEHQGKYSCSYAYLKRPFLFSAFSDPVELLISDDELSSSRIHIGASIAGLFFLFLLFGLILCYKKRRDDEPQPVLKNRGEFRVLKPQREAKPACYLTDQDIPMENLPPESSPQTQTKNVIYAELKHKSLDIQGVEELDDDTETCTYTTVKHRTRNQE